MECTGMTSKKLPVWIFMKINNIVEALQWHINKYKKLHLSDCKSRSINPRTEQVLEGFPRVAFHKDERERTMTHIWWVSGWRWPVARRSDMLKLLDCTRRYKYIWYPGHTRLGDHNPSTINYLIPSTKIPWCKVKIQPQHGSMCSK